jgi:chemotaxis-related protein WspB
MLFLLFQLGGDRYALEASRVVEVVPMLSLKRIPHAPRGVSGLFNYRGRPVPAVDLCELALNKPATLRFSTRIIIVNYPDAAGHSHLLGLIAEYATGTMRKESRDFTHPGGRSQTAPYLGPVTTDGKDIVQWIYEQRLLSESERDVLFAEVAKLGPETN